MLTIDYDLVDEQFDQLFALGKGQVFQNRLDALAKVLNPDSYGSQVKVFLRLSLQLTQLLLKTLSGSHKFLSFALELVHGDNLSQISFEQTRLLALQLRQGLLRVVRRDCSACGNHSPACARWSSWTITVGLHRS